MARTATKRESRDSLTHHVRRKDALTWPDSVDLPDDPERADRVLNIFAGVVSARQSSDWTPAELLLAANLSVSQLLVSDAQRDIMNRGATLVKLGSKGQEVESLNPNVDLLNRALSQVGTLATKLSLTASGNVNRVNKSSLERHGRENPATVERLPADGEAKPRLWKDRHLYKGAN